MDQIFPVTEDLISTGHSGLGDKVGRSFSRCSPAEGSEYKHRTTLVQFTF